MKCPNCDLEQPDQSESCPACGLIFDKWRARHMELENPDTSEPPVGQTLAEVEEALAKPSPGSFGKYSVYIYGLVLVVAAFGGWFFSIRNRPPAPGGPAPITVVPTPALSPSVSATPDGNQQNAASAFASDPFFSDPTETPDNSTPTETATFSATNTPVNTATALPTATLSTPTPVPSPRPTPTATPLGGVPGFHY
jgi:hypothetical protein